MRLTLYYLPIIRNTIMSSNKIGNEYIDYDFPSISSKRQIKNDVRVPARSSIRIGANRISAVEDRHERRIKVATHLPKCFKHL